MCKSPRFPKRPVFGGNDWYCCYGENSYEKIKNHAEKVVECSKGLEFKPYMVIDDGWWLENICPEKWESSFGTDVYKW